MNFMLNKHKSKKAAGASTFGCVLFYLWPESHGLAVAPLHGTAREKRSTFHGHLHFEALILP